MSIENLSVISAETKAPETTDVPETDKSKIDTQNKPSETYAPDGEILNGYQQDISFDPDSRIEPLDSVSNIDLAPQTFDPDARVEVPETEQNIIDSNMPETKAYQDDIQELTAPSEDVVNDIPESDSVLESGADSIRTQESGYDENKTVVDEVFETKNGGTVKFENAATDNAHKTEDETIVERNETSDNTHEKYEIEQNNSDLTAEERLQIKEETGWSDKIVDSIKNQKQYEIYKEADLVEKNIGGRACLVKRDLDLDYVSDKTIDDNHPNGVSNRELMMQGRSPYDSKTGEKLELHHMGQEYDSPLAELCENSEHGDGNHSNLHDDKKESWRRNPDLKNQYNNVDKPLHWKERSNL